MAIDHVPANIEHQLRTLHAFACAIADQNITVAEAEAGIDVDVHPVGGITPDGKLDPPGRYCIVIGSRKREIDVSERFPERAGDLMSMWGDQSRECVECAPDEGIAH